MPPARKRTTKKAAKPAATRKTTSRAAPANSAGQPARPARPAKPSSRATQPAPHADLPFSLPQVTAAEKRRAAQLLEALEEHYPTAHCELEFKSPHELLIATILSAQTTDAGVNKATPALFARFPTPADYAQSTPEEIEPFIRSLGFFRMKAKAIHAAMKDVVERYGNEIPRTMDDLLTLRGVARKTANVVLGNAFSLNFGIPVDTHVERLSQRFALVPKGTAVPKIEQKLMALFPREKWCAVSHMIIWHGRRACKARCPGGGGGAGGGIGKCSDHPICRTFGTGCECRG